MKDALADPQDMTLKAIRQDARLASKAVKTQSAAKLAELVQ